MNETEQLGDADESGDDQPDPDSGAEAMRGEADVVPAADRDRTLSSASDTNATRDKPSSDSAAEMAEARDALDDAYDPAIDEANRVALDRAHRGEAEQQPDSPVVGVHDWREPEAAMADAATAREAVDQASREADARNAVQQAYRQSHAPDDVDEAYGAPVDERNRDRLEQGEAFSQQGWETPFSPESRTGREGALPVDAEDIADRTTPNRINLADDVPAIEFKPTYDGYLDLVIHGDPTHSQADVYGHRIDFEPLQTAELIRQSSSWNQRPIRLLSCSAGQEGFAQGLADDLQVPVYAPNEDLGVYSDGTTVVMRDGKWRRFEPDWYR